MPKIFKELSFQIRKRKHTSDYCRSLIQDWGSLWAGKKHKFFYSSLHLDRGTFQQLKNVMHSILTTIDSDLFRPFEGKCFNLSNCHSIVSLKFRGKFALNVFAFLQIDYFQYDPWITINFCSFKIFPIFVKLFVKMLCVTRQLFCLLFLVSQSDLALSRSQRPLLSERQAQEVEELKTTVLENKPNKRQIWKWNLDFGQNK